MDDAVDPGERGLGRGEILNVGLHHLLARAGGAQGRDVAEAQQGVATPQSLAQHLADVTGGAGNENSGHPSLRYEALRHS